MLVNTKEMLNRAKQNKYALAHFNINNLEWTKYILEAANDLGVPIILGVSEGAAKYMGGYLVVSNMVRAFIKSLNITIDVALHLDHGQSFGSCKEAIDSGFTSVMIDASRFEYKENLKITKQVVEYARKYNVSVEAELGHIGGSEDGINSGILIAETGECIDFIHQTGIDSLAPALGTVHGVYVGTPKIDYVRMNEINKATDIPLVLHGGSGIDDNMIRKCIDNGINKININTEIQQTWAEAVRKFIESNPKVYDPRKIISSGKDNIYQEVKHKIKLFRGL